MGGEENVIQQRGAFQLNRQPPEQRLGTAGDGHSHPGLIQPLYLQCKGIITDCGEWELEKCSELPSIGYMLLWGRTGRWHSPSQSCLRITVSFGWELLL